MERFPLLRYRRKYSLFFLLHTFTPAPVLISLVIVNLLLFDQTTAQCPILPHVAAGPAADVEGGGGQRKVPAENSDS